MTRPSWPQRGRSRAGWDCRCPRPRSRRSSATRCCTPRWSTASASRSTWAERHAPPRPPSAERSPCATEDACSPAATAPLRGPTPITSASGRRDEGPTDLDNVILLCRRHHRVAHRNGWNVELDGDGWTRWTTPSGHARWGQRHHRHAALTVRSRCRRRARSDRPTPDRRCTTGCNCAPSPRHGRARHPGMTRCTVEPMLGPAGSATSARLQVRQGRPAVRATPPGAGTRSATSRIGWDCVRSGTARSLRLPR